jgi:hypothetical protein
VFKRCQDQPPSQRLIFASTPCRARLGRESALLLFAREGSRVVVVDVKDPGGRGGGRGDRGRRRRGGLREGPAWISGKTSRGTMFQRFVRTLQ